MSAYLVNEEHIAEIAKAWRELKQEYGYNLYTKRMIKGNVVRELTKQNLKSLNARYGENELTGKEEEKYIAKAKELSLGYAKVDMFDLYKMVQCYMYQSCEHEEWRETDAYFICESIKEVIATRIVDAAQEKKQREGKKAINWSYTA